MKLFPLLILSLPGLLAVFWLRAETATAPAPAPAVDRVGFPRGYLTEFVVLRHTTDTKAAKQVTVYGNALAASITNLAALPYPYGSILVMETVALEPDAAGLVLPEASGKYRKGAVKGLHVMRREPGFGEAYRTNRTGEWEYVEYLADGKYLTPPEKSAACAECHVKAGPARDFVFKARFAPEGGK